jgi:hypothetical protein
VPRPGQQRISVAIGISTAIERVGRIELAVGNELEARGRQVGAAIWSLRAR